MPELPEVHTIVTNLTDGGIIGSTVTAVSAAWARSVGGDAAEFSRRVMGRAVTAIARRGKFIRVDLDADGSLLIHLRMSGRLFLQTEDEPSSPYDRVTLHLRAADGGRRVLRFFDPRKFGRMEFFHEPNVILGKLGIEPLDPEFTSERLFTMLSGRKRRIKPFLLDQHNIAGLGNIYVDEALWEAGIHPLRPASSIDFDDAETLVTAVQTVVRKGIRNLGTSLGHGVSNFVFPGRDTQAHNQEHLHVFQRTGLPCDRCATLIQRVIVEQRSSHVCPRCQRYP